MIVIALAVPADSLSERSILPVGYFVIASMRSDSAVFSLPDSPSGLTFAAKLTIFLSLYRIFFLFFQGHCRENAPFVLSLAVISFLFALQQHCKSYIIYII